VSRGSAEAARGVVCGCTRRSAIAAMCAGWTVGTLPARAAVPDQHRVFVAAAFRMKDDAVRRGDQPYGAVVVKDGRIVGDGPSRVVLKNDATAHAEREAIRDAQAKLGSADLSGCLLYSTSRACPMCERSAAEANIARMFFGADARDAGPPRRT
jgi:tRNA(Arg) A34 adenosine deaminase TadA